MLGFDEILDAVRSELEASRQKLVEKEENILQYRAIADSSESALAELQQTYDEFKIKIQTREEEHLRQMESLRSELDEAKERMGDFDNVLAKVEEKHASNMGELREIKEALEMRVSYLENSEASAVSMREKLQEDLAAQARLASEAQQRYNQELIAHAGDVAQLESLKTELQHLKDEMIAQKSGCEKAEHALATAEASWSSQRQLFTRSIEDLEKRCLDLEALNIKLHEDYENVKASAIREFDTVTISDSATLDGSNAVQTQVTVDNLREVLELLRKENGRLILQRDLAQQESSRLKRELAITQHSLDQSRASLASERKHLEVSMQTQKHEELLAKIDELNIVRESNATLRLESKFANERIQGLVSELEVLRAEVGPLKQELMEAQIKIDVFEEERQQLVLDRDQWRERSAKILATHKRVDPMEHEKLQAELQRIQQESDALKSDFESAKAKCEQLTLEKEQLADRMAKFKEAASTWRAKYKEIEKEAQQLKESQDSMMEVANQTSEAERSAWQTEKDALLSEKASLQEQLKLSLENHANLKEKFNKLRHQALEYREKARAAEAEIAEMKANVDERDGSNEIKAVREELETCKKRNEELELRMSQLLDDLRAKEVEEAPSVSISEKRTRDDTSDAVDVAIEKAEDMDIDMPVLKRPKLNPDAKPFSFAFSENAGTPSLNPEAAAVNTENQEASEMVDAEEHVTEEIEVQQLNEGDIQDNVDEETRTEHHKEEDAADEDQEFEITEDVLEDEQEEEPKLAETLHSEILEPAVASPSVENAELPRTDTSFGTISDVEKPKIKKISFDIPTDEEHPEAPKKPVEPSDVPSQKPVKSLNKSKLLQKLSAAKSVQPETPSSNTHIKAKQVGRGMSPKTEPLGSGVFALRGQLAHIVSSGDTATEGAGRGRGRGGQIQARLGRGRGLGGSNAE